MNPPQPQGEPAAPEALVPRIIQPTEHPIKTSMIDRDALYILRKLHDAGFAGYLVGGGVRDLFLGKSPKDFDISTDARPGQLRKLFPNSRTIGRRFRLVQVFFKGGKTIEVSTLRSMSEHDLDGPESVLAPDNTFGTVSEDARRRDLTINSLFYTITDETIVDYVNGCQDLIKGIIRIVGEPAKRIARDPVRMMRAIRHGARNSFSIESNTWTAIKDSCRDLSLCPPSRIRDEILKDFYSGASAPWFTLCLESGIFAELFPIYRRLLADNDCQERVSKRLQAVFTTIDRVNNLCVERGSHRQPDYFLFALFLTPWAEESYRLFSQPRKGGQLFQLGKGIREEIDAGLGISLNLRRSFRQETSGLLVNLAQLVQANNQGNWPKWLKKKSYFKKGQLLYHFYQESQGQGQIPDQLLGITASSENLPPPVNRPEPESSSSQLQRTRPAFSKKKGGIFGLKK